MLADQDALGHLERIEAQWPPAFVADGADFQVLEAGFGGQSAVVVGVGVDRLDDQERYPVVQPQLPQVSIAVVVLPLPVLPARSACLVRLRTGSVMSRSDPAIWPIRIDGPAPWKASACPKCPRRTRNPGTVPSTAMGSRNAQLASRASPMTLSSLSCGSGGSGRAQISGRPGSSAKSSVARFCSARRRCSALRRPHLVGGHGAFPFQVAAAARVGRGDSGRDHLHDARRQAGGRRHLDPQREGLLAEAAGEVTEGALGVDRERVRSQFLAAEVKAALLLILAG